MIRASFPDAGDRLRIAAIRAPLPGRSLAGRSPADRGTGGQRDWGAENRDCRPLQERDLLLPADVSPMGTGGHAEYRRPLRHRAARPDPGPQRPGHEPRIVIGAARRRLPVLHQGVPAATLRCKRTKTVPYNPILGTGSYTASHFLQYPSARPGSSPTSSPGAWPTTGRFSSACSTS